VTITIALNEAPVHVHSDSDSDSVGSATCKTDSELAGFFHRNRVLLRFTKQKAMDAHCPDTGPAPLIPLMLGGVALTLCKELDEHQRHSSSFTLGVGVVIAKQ